MEINVHLFLISLISYGNVEEDCGPLPSSPNCMVCYYADVMLQDFTKFRLVRDDLLFPCNFVGFAGLKLCSRTVARGD